MNQLNRLKRILTIHAMLEGCSVASACRLAKVSKVTALNLLRDIGTASAKYHDHKVVKLTCRRIQADEIWAFIYSKQKNTSIERQVLHNHGHSWLWLAIDADTKLIVSYYVGLRDEDSAKYFIHDLSSRLTHRIQLTTDGLHWYLEAVQEAFGSEVDYAQLVKDFVSKEPSITIQDFIGSPDEKHISTSYIERFNLTMRMSNRRFTRKTNAFSRKVDNHYYAVALNILYYNFARVHSTLKTTPAIAAGISKKVWTIDDMVRILLRDEEA